MYNLEKSLRHSLLKLYYTKLKQFTLPGLSNRKWTNKFHNKKKKCKAKLSDKNMHIVKNGRNI